MNEYIEAPSSPRPRVPRRARDEHRRFFSIFSLEFSFLSLSLLLLSLSNRSIGFSRPHVISEKMTRLNAFEPDWDFVLLGNFSIINLNKINPVFFTPGKR